MKYKIVRIIELLCGILILIGGILITPLFVDIIVISIKEAKDNFIGICFACSMAFIPAFYITLGLYLVVNSIINLEKEWKLIE